MNKYQFVSNLNQLYQFVAGVGVGNTDKGPKVAFTYRYDWN